MTKYVAFLRGINVGGKNIIKMEDLKKIFISLDFSNVKTFIQSGNVIFESKESSKTNLSKKIEKAILKHFDYDVVTILRTADELEDLIKNNPFNIQLSSKEKIKYYICFLSGKPGKIPELPLISPKKDMEVIQIKNNNACVISREINGHYGFPNNFIEDKLKVFSTSRNYSTILKLVEHK